MWWTRGRRAKRREHQLLSCTFENTKPTFRSNPFSGGRLPSEKSDIMGREGRGRGPGPRRPRDHNGTNTAAASPSSSASGRPRGGAGTSGTSNWTPPPRPPSGSGRPSPQQGAFPWSDGRGRRPSSSPQGSGRGRGQQSPGWPFHRTGSGSSTSSRPNFDKERQFGRGSEAVKYELEKKGGVLTYKVMSATIINLLLLLRQIIIICLDALAIGAPFCVKAIVFLGACR